METAIAQARFSNAQIVQFNHSPTFSLDNEVADTCDHIVSFGFNGGLVEGFSVGDVTYASAVRIDKKNPLAIFVPDEKWTTNLIMKLRYGNIYPKEAKWYSDGIENESNTVDERKTYSAYGDVMDDETFFVVQYAVKKKIPWTVLRVISDDYKMNLPTAATGQAINPDGSANTAYVMQQVEKDPWEIPALIQLAIDLGYIKGVLNNVGYAIGTSFGT